MEGALTGTLVPCAVAVCLFLCMGGQVVHCFLRVMVSQVRTRASVVVYEVTLAAHLAVMAVLALGALAGGAVPADLLWANVFVACVAAYAALSGAGDPEDRTAAENAAWTPAVEVVLACACTPPVQQAVGGAWAAVACADAGYFLFRTVFLLAHDARTRSRLVTTLSVVQAVKLLPEGVMSLDKRGHIVFQNDVMRDCLARLGLAGGFSGVDDLFGKLGDLAVKEVAGERLADGEEPNVAGRAIVRMGPREVRSFTWGRQLGRGAADAWVIARDVTPEMRMLEEIGRANDELAASQQELRSSMETVREAAENEALLRMRSRVHDVIGQRLSLLHRALEDDVVSDEQIQQMMPLLGGILSDLAADEHIDPRDELAATVDAFALTGVVVSVEGGLPDDPQRAKLFADCVREAATNAVKHARAGRIDVRMRDGELVVESDGALPARPVREGSGLSSMRRAVEALGGTMRINADEPPFALRIALP